MWNGLPEDVVSAKGVNSFKGRVDRFLRKNEGIYEP